MNRKETLPSLTSPRFLAALWVALGHYIGWHAAVLSAFPPVMQAPLGVFTTTGSDAVSFFFVLSGLILTYTYLTPDGTLRGSARSFYVARIARIYPAYVLAFILAALPYTWSFGTRGVPGTGLAALSLTQSWWPGVFISQQWNGPAWSVSTEAGFYLLFPLLAPALAHLSRRGLLYLLILCWMLTMILPGLDTPGLWPSDAWYWASWGVLQVSPLGRLPEFLIGCCACLLFLRRSQAVSSGWRVDLLTGATLAMLVAGVAV
jgi:peptidoglycan/LPS O-acetylase OafA/YrhL